MKCNFYILFSLITTQYCSFGLAHRSIENTIEKRGPPVDLGLAATFGAIAATTLTSTGNSLITGDCGTCPGTSITGFPPGFCTGTTDAGSTSACDAEFACLTAYDYAAGLVPTSALPSADLAGSSIPPGVYTFPTVPATLSANVTLNGTSNPGGQWIFQIRTTFTTAVDSQVVLINGAQACNVFFVVGSSSTIAGATTLKGNVLAYTSVAVGSAASNDGVLCALNGAVTLIDNAITTQPVCFKESVSD